MVAPTYTTPSLSRLGGSSVVCPYWRKSWTCFIAHVGFLSDWQLKVDITSVTPTTGSANLKQNIYPDPCSNLLTLPDDLHTFTATIWDLRRCYTHAVSTSGYSGAVPAQYYSMQAFGRYSRKEYLMITYLCSRWTPSNLIFKRLHSSIVRAVSGHTAMSDIKPLLLSGATAMSCPKPR